METLFPVKEAAYLTAVNAEIYRDILRVCYREYEHMHFQLYKEEIMELLKEKYPEKFSEYSMDNLKSDLNALVEWKNLIPFQDPTRVYTIADYKNKQFRYAMSEAAVEIERMTIKLENLFLSPANLSTNYFLKIENSLDNITNIKGKDLKEINEWWRNLQDDFKRLNQNYQDYHREFYTGRSEKILKSVEFITHKDKFISYLQDFIKELQKHSDIISSIIRKIDEKEKKELLIRIVESELAIPRPLSEKEDDLEKHIKDDIYGKWYSFERWFVSKNGIPSESERVLDITNEVIQKIIQNAALIVQLQNWGISRKSDYKHYIQMFLDCENIDDAHKLSAHVFGVQNVRHFKAAGDRMTDSISNSTSEEEPPEFLLNSHNKKYKPRIDKTGFVEKSFEKAAKKQEYFKQLEKNKEMVMKYINENKLSISEINDVVSENTRVTLLRWISNANMTSTRTGLTDYGQKYRLLKDDGVCVLHCEDGDLELPCYTFEFGDES